MKKIALFFPAVLLIALVSVFCAASASADSIQDNINRLLAVYPSGSYFTVSGSSCSPTAETHATAEDGPAFGGCANCKLDNIPARGGLPAGIEAGSGNWTCMAFARYAFYVINGTTWNNTTQRSGVKASEVYLYAKPGDYIRYPGHGGIFIRGDATGFYMYEANYIRTIAGVSYCEYKHTQNNCTITHANNYPDDPTPASPPVFSGVSIIPDFTISGISQGFITSGTITSAYPITKVTTYFVDATTGAVKQRPGVQYVNLNSTSVDIATQVDKVIYFAQLDIGTWKLVYEAQNSHGDKTTYETNAFHVYPDSVSSISVSGFPNIPDMTKSYVSANGFYTSGTIESTYPVKKVEGYFVYANTDNLAPKPALQSVSLNGTHINIATQVDQILYFAQLQTGTWQLALKITDSQGYSYTFKSNVFTIIDGECDCSESVAGWYRVASTGLNINSGHNWTSYIGEMPPYALCWVSKGSLTQNYYHVSYEGLEGISSKNLLTRLDSYTLSFDDQGGAGGPGSVTVWDGVSDYCSVPIPSRNNHNFLGYYTADGLMVYNAAGSCTNEGSYWSNNAYVHGSGATLYARWEIRFVYAESITLDRTELTMTLGHTDHLYATVLPANATNKSVSWESSLSSVATVSNGAIEAVGIGSTTITAKTCDGTNLIAACKVTVLPVYVESIELTASASQVTEGEFLAIETTVLPTEASNKELIWSSTAPEIASVEYGRVQANAPGTAVIKALAADGSNISAELTVTVAPYFTIFDLPYHSAVMSASGLGSRYPVTVNVAPSDLKDILIWSSSNPQVAVVDAQGVVTAKSPGRAVISVELPHGPSDSCIIQVRDDMGLLTLPSNLLSIEEEAFAGITAERVAIRDACTTIGKNAFRDSAIRYLLIPATVTDIAEDAFDGASQICLVCSEGSAAQYYAENKGIHYIIDEEAAFISVRSVSLPDTLSLEIEDQLTLNAAVLPANASNPAMIWSSSREDIASVSADGVVSGINPGTAVITATASDGSGRTASCQVTVTLPNVTVQSSAEITYQTGAQVTAQLNAVITISGAEAEKVQQAGLLIYDANGNRLGISADAPSGEGNTLNCVCSTDADMDIALTPNTAYQWRAFVVVKGIAFYSAHQAFTTPSLPPQIVLSTQSLTMEAGTSQFISAIVLYTEDTNILWSTSNSSVAMVIDGEIMARSAGKATITVRLASNPEISAACVVTVADTASFIPSWSMTLSASALSLTRGSTANLEAAVQPSPGPGPIQWTSDNPSVAVVDGNGTVTAISAGCANIFARLTGTDLQKTCEVTVAPCLVASIVLSQSSLSMQVGSMDRLTAEIMPLSADNRTITWHSSEPAIAAVEEGLITAVSVGTAVITASAVDGSGVQGCCSVTVTSSPLICGCETSYGGTYVVTRTQGAGLAISSGHGPSTAAGNTELGIIPESTEIYISRASGPAGQSGCWGHVTYGGVSGYCAMYYVDPVLNVDTSNENVNASKLSAVISQANAWVDFVWTAPADIPVYNNIYLSHDEADSYEFAYQKQLWYPMGTLMHGVPYTLAPGGAKYALQAYSLLSAQNKGAAAEFTYGGYKMWGPQYGGDCMCLVNDALCAGDSTLPHNGRMPVKEYLFTHPSWDELAPGDALLKATHAMIVVDVQGDSVTIVESRGNGTDHGAIYCPNAVPRQTGGWYVCGECDYCNGTKKCGSVRRTLSKASLQQEYTIYRYKMLYLPE